MTHRSNRLSTSTVNDAQNASLSACRRRSSAATAATGGRAASAAGSGTRYTRCTTISRGTATAQVEPRARVRRHIVVLLCVDGLSPRMLCFVRITQPLAGVFATSHKLRQTNTISTLNSKP